MSINSFANPKTFFSPDARSAYLGGGKERAYGGLKLKPWYFQVSEKKQDGEEPGYLTIGPQSDFSPEALQFSEAQARERCVWVSVVKVSETTWGVRDEIARTLSEQLQRKIHPEAIYTTGLKDRGAYTVQVMQIRGVTAEEIRGIRCPLTQEGYERGTRGFFFKDVRPPRGELAKGSHRFNHFKIKIVLEGQGQEAIAAYLKPRLERLARLDYLIPNPYDNQRLGRRQIQGDLGRKLIVGGFPNRVGEPPFSSNIEAAMYRFICEVVPGSEKPDAEALRRECGKLWLYDFDKMAKLLERNHKRFGMEAEYKLATRLAGGPNGEGDFEGVFTATTEECSFWVAAWQSTWWNHVLANELPRWTELLERQLAPGYKAGPNDFRAVSARIPMLMATESSRSYYQKLPYCRAAVAELDKAPKVVRDMCLVPYDGNQYGPKRKVFISVDNLKHTIEDGAVDFEFDLRNGAYATGFLSLLWDLTDPDAVETTVS